MSYFNEDQQDYIRYLSTIPRAKKCQCGWYLKDECMNAHCCEDGRRNVANKSLEIDAQKTGRDMDDKAVDGKKVLVDGILVLNCQDCPHLSRGFLSEPNECGYFKEAYKWFVPRSGIPAWCPMPDKDRAKAK